MSDQDECICPVCGAKLVEGLDFEGYALLHGDDAAQEAFGVDLSISGIVQPEEHRRGRGPDGA